MVFWIHSPFGFAHVTVFQTARWIGPDIFGDSVARMMWLLFTLFFELLDEHVRDREQLGADGIKARFMQMLEQQKT
jgi:hypothetical protein